MKSPAASNPLSIWQSALLQHGCQMKSGDHFIPLELHAVGDRIFCTPTVNGAMLPFNIQVTVDAPVIITWDSELSRYGVTAAGRRLAA